MPEAGSRSSPTIRTGRSPASRAPSASAIPWSRNTPGASSVPPGLPRLSMGTPTTTIAFTRAGYRPPRPVARRGGRAAIAQLDGSTRACFLVQYLAAYLTDEPLVVTVASATTAAGGRTSRTRLARPASRLTVTVGAFGNEHASRSAPVTLAPRPAAESVPALP